MPQKAGSRWAESVIHQFYLVYMIKLFYPV
jgi:hypothetical protein